MPKRQNYESDGGFVEDAPRDKKRKSEASSKKDSSALKTTVQEDDDGNSFWEITNSKRIVISTFKGTKMVSIREYYEKDGKSLPGKKGISLPIEQFSTLVELLPAIENALSDQGVNVPRPNYDARMKAPATEEEDEISAEESEEDDDAVPTKKSVAARGKLDKFKMKKNHEATDEEDA